MHHPNTATALAAALLAAAASAASAATVCTITVNSADEREAFRRYLPGDHYDFVELVERGRPDWLASSCRKGVQCDVLLVSGHFAGTEFYSSRFDAAETLPVSEVERVQCSESCPGLFSKLKEVYLFGCDTLKPEPVKTTAAEIIRDLERGGMPRSQAEEIARDASHREGEASRDVMRRLFPGVPVIYGFASLAPYGRTAGPMLARYFQSGGDAEIGSGVASAKLLAMFGPSSMTSTAGVRADEPDSAFRAEACRFADERVPLAAKIDVVRRELAAPMPELRMEFDRVEEFLADRRAAQPAELAMALEPLAADAVTRTHYLRVVRDTADPALRVRMISLARGVGWLDADEARAETVRMVADLMAGDAVGYGEVDLICSLNRDGTLAPALEAARNREPRTHAVALEAARACLGSGEARTGVLRALASRDEGDVQIAQAYLRHHPIDAAEMHAAVLRVAAMPASSAQVRALETLARQHIADAAALDELARLFARSGSLAVQRAIAEVFLRCDARSLGPRTAAMLRATRVRSPGGEDLIDAAIRRLEARPSA